MCVSDDEEIDLFVLEELIELVGGPFAGRDSEDVVFGCGVDDEPDAVVSGDVKSGGKGFEPGDGFGGGDGSAVHIGDSGTCVDGPSIVIAACGLDAFGFDSIDDKVGEWSVADEIAGGEDSIDAEALEVIDGPSEREGIGVDVGDEAEAHGTLLEGDLVSWIGLGVFPEFDRAIGGGGDGVDHGASEAGAFE
jgi:hypothetical protein